MILQDWRPISLKGGGRRIRRSKNSVVEWSKSPGPAKARRTPHPPGGSVLIFRAGRPAHPLSYVPCLSCSFLHPTPSLLHVLRRLFLLLLPFLHTAAVWVFLFLLSASFAFSFSFGCLGVLFIRFFFRSCLFSLFFVVYFVSVDLL